MMSIRRCLASVSGSRHTPRYLAIPPVICVFTVRSSVKKPVKNGVLFLSYPDQYLRACRNWSAALVFELGAPLEVFPLGPMCSIEEVTYRRVTFIWRNYLWHYPRHGSARTRNQTNEVVSDSPKKHEVTVEWETTLSLNIQTDSSSVNLVWNLSRRQDKLTHPCHEVL